MKYPTIALALAATLGQTQTVPQVHLGDVVITGKQSKLGPSVESFQGIPYAEPPVGGLRLQTPVLKTSLNGTTFNATAYGPACLQPGMALNVSSEDCLSLNIFRPAGIDNSMSLPVMFWVHGGGFTTGASSNFLFDGTSLVNRSMSRGTPIIYISINYRLGPLGFPLGSEAKSQQALNLGLKDQLTALHWVQQNIGAFGGDNSKVTIFGESAGARSIDYHMFGDSLKDLARAAIVESSSRLPIFDPEHSENVWHTFVAAVPECASVAQTSETFQCLKGSDINSTSLYKAVTQFTNIIGPFQPVIDGKDGLVPDFPSQMTPRSPLPMISGSNLDEGTIFTPQNVSSETELRNLVINATTPSPRGSEALANATDELLKLYPDDPAVGSPFGSRNETFGLSSQYKRYAALYGDFAYQSSRRYLSQSRSQAGVKVYSYHFRDSAAAALGQLFLTKPVAPGSIGISHGFELPYLFGALPLVNVTSPTALQLSGMIQEYWLSFATSLDPNDGKGLDRAKWEAYSLAAESIIQFDGGNITMIPDIYRKYQIDFIYKDPLLFRR